MRITGGKHRNRKMTVPKGSAIRPTTDMTRQALFNRLGARTNVEGCRVLDLFAGSGSLGIEALSRGAEHVVFVDSSGAALRTIKQNLESIGEVDSAVLIKNDSITFIEDTSLRPDIVLADPPYAYSNIDRLIEASHRILSSGGYLIIEHDASYEFSEHPHFVVSGSYGRTKLTFFGSE